MKNTTSRRLRPRLAALGAIAMTLFAVGLARPVAANPPNQSDITGTNVFNSVAPDFFDEYGDRLDPATIAEAERLSTQLSRAYTACLESAEVAQTLPRRFARGSSRPTNCSSPQCRQFESLLQETRQFLAGIEASTTDLDQFLRDRPW